MMDLNSQDYWDTRFNSNWEAAGGKNQTRFFMQLLLENIPEELINDIKDNNPTILDWGCALGQGVDEISKHFPEAQVCGLDFSPIAIKQCQTDYPSGTFRSACLDPDVDHFDIIISSNCFEHFTDPLEELTKHLQCTQKYYILLVPYAEKLPLCPEHQITIDHDTFPASLCGFSRYALKIINARGKGCWNGEQMLIIYKKSDI